MPWRARPASSTGKELAVAQIREPAANSTARISITRFLPKASASLPTSGKLTTATKLTIVSTHPRCRVRKSPVMCGIAGYTRVISIGASSDISTMSASAAPYRQRCRRPSGGSSLGRGCSLLVVVSVMLLSIR